MTTVVNFLKGKKTFTLVGVALLVLVLKHFGLLDSALADQVVTALGLGSLLTLRLALDGK